MKRLKAKYTAFMHRHFKRYRLRKICQAIGIKPYPWQRDFALGKTDALNAPEGRATGKTMACMLRLIMETADRPAEPLRTLMHDPDFRLQDRPRLRWYAGEIRRLSSLCIEKGIPLDDYLTRIGP